MAEYGIKDLEILTGIKAHTIRIWEKRYNLIAPGRTETQIRKYSDEELKDLLIVSLLYKNNVKISKIAEMNSSQRSSKMLEFTSSTIDESTQELILSLIEMDEIRFKETIQNNIDKTGLEDTFSNLLVPFLDRLGIMYLVGTINPAQEHFISTLTRQKIISEIDKLPIPSKEEKPVLLYLPEHEWHELSLLFYQFILRKRGVSTLYFGQSLPYNSLIESIGIVQPKALLTSWLTSIEEQFIIDYFSQLKKDIGEIPIIAGGYQISTYYSKIEANVKQIKSLDDLLSNF
jgi:DNA-binding transcriptional MerR regulator